MDFILQAGRTAEVSMQDQFFHVWCCHITDTKLFLVAGNLDTNSFCLPKVAKEFLIVILVSDHDSGDRKSRKDWGSG